MHYLAGWTAEAMHDLTLVSFTFCPYVQWAAIVLEEKGVSYERVEIDLLDKPDWFMEWSPRGKVPALVVDGAFSLLESSAIAEYLDEVLPGARLHPEDPVSRAQDRAWILGGTEVGVALFRLVTAASPQDGQAAKDQLCTRLADLDAYLGDGPYFRGASFSLVDASLAPLLQHVYWVDQSVPGLKLMKDLDALAAWLQHLRQRPSVRATTPEGGQSWYRDLILSRDRLTQNRTTWLSTQMT
jgi:glutathione S-transferase